MSSVSNIQLTREEGFICTLLDDVCHWMQASNPSVEVDGQVHTYKDLCIGSDASDQPSSASTITCEARIAGGWVRDKLLGLPSHDLDVSLSSLTGHQFALFLKAYLESDRFSQTKLAHEIAMHLPHRGAMGTIGKIAANPEQSKNLETATTNVLGFDLDFVNLRKEVYEGTHRIPVMSFGTPLDDAMRRDITVNALFYNVHTASIEDWTEHGLHDLHHGIVRTPMDPASTFNDDPLRILRCVRFSSRFGYEIHSDIRSCLCETASDGGSKAKNPSTAELLRSALLNKVSRERFGIEVDKMLSGRDPFRALQLLSELGLYKVVFTPPPPLIQRMGTSSGGAQIDAPADIPDENVALFLAACFDDLLQGTGTYADLWAHIPHDWLDTLRTSPTAASKQRLIWYALALFPLRDIYVQPKKQKEWAGLETISKGLKLGNRNTKDPVACLDRAVSVLSRPSLDRFKPDSCLTQRSTIGLLLRQSCITSPSLDVGLDNTLLFALFCDLATVYDAQNDTLDKDSAINIIDEYARFWAFVRDERLLDYAQVKPILDGRQVAEALPCEKFLLTRVLPFVVAWQIDHATMDAPLAERQAQCAKDLHDAWSSGHLIPVSERTQVAKSKKT